jgi:hypothetical protein
MWVFGSSGKAANFIGSENSKAFVSVVVFSPSLSNSIVESKRQWVAKVLAASYNKLSLEVSNTELVRETCATSACPDGVAAMAPSPGQVDARPCGAVTPPRSLPHAALPPWWRFRSRSMRPQAQRPVGCADAICMPAAELAMDVADVASGGELTHAGRCTSPLRSPRVSRLVGSPHAAGTTLPWSPSTPLRASSLFYQAVVVFGGILYYSKAGLRSSS